MILWLVAGILFIDMAMGQNQVPLVNIPKMNRIVFMGMFTYPFLVIIGIDPPPNDLEKVHLDVYIYL